jgi:hypothetical protein
LSPATMPHLNLSPNLPWIRPRPLRRPVHQLRGQPQQQSRQENQPRSSLPCRLSPAN